VTDLMRHHRARRPPIRDVLNVDIHAGTREAAHDVDRRSAHRGLVASLFVELDDEAVLTI
jgi:hypothetical protein